MSTSFIAAGFMTLVPDLAVTLGANVGTTLIVQVAVVLLVRWAYGAERMAMQSCMAPCMASAWSISTFLTRVRSFRLHCRRGSIYDYR